jgi:tetratricopeptide (TPR) repeat protein
MMSKHTGRGMMMDSAENNPKSKPTAEARQALIDEILEDQAFRDRLVQTLVEEVETHGTRRWWRRIQAFLAGLSSGLVLLLAFLLPSIQDQWERRKSHVAIERYAELGRSLMQKDQYSSAEQAFTKALELSGDLRIDLLEEQMKARVARINEDPDWPGHIPEELTESDFQYLLELQQGDDHRESRSETLSAYGAFLASQRRWREAEQSIHEAMTINPQDPGPHIHMGNLLRDQDLSARAEAEYRKALALDPKNPSAHYNLGLLLAETGRYELAEEEFRRYTELEPNASEGFSRLGEILRSTGRTVEAIEACEKAVRLDPRDTEAQKALRALTNNHKSSTVK